MCKLTQRQAKSKDSNCHIDMQHRLRIFRLHSAVTQFVSLPKYTRPLSGLLLERNISTHHHLLQGFCSRGTYLLIITYFRAFAREEHIYSSSLTSGLLLERNISTHHHLLQGFCSRGTFLLIIANVRAFA